MIIDLSPLPDEAAVLIPALIEAVAVWPEKDRLGRTLALLITLARNAGLHGAHRLSQDIDSLDVAVQWALRVLLVSCENQQAASKAWALAIDTTSKMADFPDASLPPSEEPSPPPRRSSPTGGTHPTGGVYDVQTSLLRNISEAAARGAQAPTHRIVAVDTFGITYSIPRASGLAAELLAAAQTVARVRLPHPQQEILRLPKTTIAFLAILSSEHERSLLLAEELAVSRMRNPSTLLIALRACRMATPPIENEELEVWLSGGIQLLWNGIPIECSKHSMNVSRPRERTCRLCGKNVPEGVSFAEHQGSRHCAPSKNGQAGPTVGALRK